MNKSRVEVRILNPREHAKAVLAHFESWFVPDREDLFFGSPLDADLLISDHLKWFHGMLQFHRKFIRQLEAAGVQTVVRISMRDRFLSLEPEALLLAHQMHLTTHIDFV